MQFSEILVNYKGEELLEREGVKMTLGGACITALDAFLPTDKDEPLSKKLERGRLIGAIFQSMSTETDFLLTSEEISLIKERVGKTFTAASVIRRICQRLDPAVQ